MKTAVIKETREARNIQISLRIDDESALKKLTKANSTMPSWVLGEEIAKRLNNGIRGIEINLSSLFLAHQV
jgi:hypothetical protein